MNCIRSFFGFLFFCCLFLVSCSSENNKIVFATAAKISPFEFYENNKLIGFDIELAELIGKELKKKVVFKDTHYQNIFSSLQNNYADVAISTLIYSQKRAERFLFSKPYYRAEMSFVYNADDKSVNKIEDFNGKTITCIYGSVLKDWFQKHVPQAKIVYFNNEMAAVKSLESKLIDGIFLEKNEAINLVEKNKKFAMISAVDLMKDFCLIVKKNNEDLKIKIDEILSKLEKNGDLDRLRKKWLKTENMN